jgi:hypothetical protein
MQFPAICQSLLRIADPPIDLVPLVRRVLAVEGLAADLVIWNEDRAGYRQLNDQIWVDHPALSLT